MIRLIVAIVFVLGFSIQAIAQESGASADDGRNATGGAQTLEDILARQRGETVAPKSGDARSAAQDLAGQLGVRGAQSDSELWRALRYNDADVSVSAGGDVAKVLVQDGGMAWYEFRKGPLSTYGGYLLLGTLAALALFYLLRGKIMIDGKKTGKTITRFQAIERFSHWLLAISFILLGITGLITLFGRTALIPVFGKEAFAIMAEGSKWVHNNVSWAFMLALIMVFVLWVVHNIPNRTDLKWLAVGGGIFKKGVHPPAKKFNAGQKLIFWSVIVLGGSISASGLSLLFPFELPMFAKTFQILNATGLPNLLGFGVLPEQMAPHEEMQYAQLWHAIVSFVLMAIILAHIYIGSVGMEGAFDAMGSGEVEEQWAREHHSLWVEEVKSASPKEPKSSATTAPAE